MSAARLSRSLGPAEITIHCLDLDAPPAPGEAEGADPSDWLSAFERERLAVLPPGPRRDDFLRLRLWLRRVIAGALDRRPERLRLGRTAHGKPCLLSAEPGAANRFNLAHAGRLALLALCPSHEVGVDLERDRPLLRVDGLARRVLSPVEREALLGLPEPDRPRAFLRLWVRKEACLKATGRGLGFGPARFSVPTTPWLEGVRVDLPPATSGEGARAATGAEARAVGPVAEVPHAATGAEARAAAGGSPESGGSGFRCWLADLEMAPPYEAAVAVADGPPRANDA